MLKKSGELLRVQNVRRGACHWSLGVGRTHHHFHDLRDDGRLEASKLNSVGGLGGHHDFHTFLHHRGDVVVHVFRLAVTDVLAIRKQPNVAELKSDRNAGVVAVKHVFQQITL